MAKIKRSKKGIVFTLGLSILVIIILLFAIIIFRYSSGSSERVTRLNLLDRIYDLDNSITEGFIIIFNEKAKVNVSVSRYNLTLEELLPNNNKQEFITAANKYKNFVEENYNFINISLGEMYNKFKLRIEPFGYEITHNEFGGNTINMNHNNNATAYQFYFWAKDKNATIDWEKYSPGSTEVRIIFESPGWHKESTKTINPSGENEIELDANGELLDVDIDEETIKIINENSNTTILSKTTITFNKPYPKVLIPNIVGINFKEFNVSKINSIKLS